MCTCICTKMTVELTMEFTLIIRLGEPLIRDGKSNIESNAGARWFTCMCSSYPSFENFCGSGYKIDNPMLKCFHWTTQNAKAHNVMPDARKLIQIQKFPRARATNESKKWVTT